MRLLTHHCVLITAQKQKCPHGSESRPHEGRPLKAEHVYCKHGRPSVHTEIHLGCVLRAPLRCIRQAILPNHLPGEGEESPRFAKVRL